MVEETDRPQRPSLQSSLVGSSGAQLHRYARQHEGRRVARPHFLASLLPRVLRNVLRRVPTYYQACMCNEVVSMFVQDGTMDSWPVPSTTHRAF